MVRLTSRSASTAVDDTRSAERATGTGRPSGPPAEGAEAEAVAGIEDPGRRGWAPERLGELVHRADLRDAFPTGLTPLTETQFSVSARWPRAHRFFAPVGRHQDPLLIAETMRQTTMLIAHAQFGVPVGDAFVMWELRYTSASERLERNDEPWDITVDVSCSRIRRRGRSLGSMHLELLLHRRGTVLATGGGRISCSSARAYQKMRGHRGAVLGTPIPLLPAVAPRTVGRTREQDVVLSPDAAPGAWQLRLDTRHPTLFGRPNDHVPGILLLEAARQAAHAAGGAPFLPTTMQADFHQYVELDRPCRIEATELPAEGSLPAGVRVRAVQDGAPAFTCDLFSADLPALPHDVRSDRA